MNNSADPVSSQPIPDAIGRLSSFVDRLHGNLSMLEDRLSPALSPKAPEPQTGANAKPSHCELAATIHNLGDALLEASGRVESLLQRLGL